MTNTKQNAMTTGDRLGGDPDAVARDLDAILCGHLPEVAVLGDEGPDVVAARIRAAYSLGCKSAFDMIDAIDSAFRAIGHEMKPVMRIGVESDHDIPAGAIEQMRVCPQEPFQPLWIIVDGTVADLFAIRGTYIRTAIQESAFGFTPCGVLTRERGIYDIARLDAMTLGAVMTVEVLNRSAVPAQFRMAVFGRPPVTRDGATTR